MTKEAFNNYWLKVHAPLVKKLPGIIRYVQNRIIQNGDPESQVDGYVELWFESLAAFEKAFESPAGQKLRQDDKNFIGSIHMMFVEEHVIVP